MREEILIQCSKSYIGALLMTQVERRKNPWRKTRMTQKRADAWIVADAGFREDQLVAARPDPGDVEDEKFSRRILSLSSISSCISRALENA